MPTLPMYNFELRTGADADKCPTDDAIKTLYGNTTFQSLARAYTVRLSRCVIERLFILHVFDDGCNTANMYEA
jgi:hypothetical protein